MATGDIETTLRQVRRQVDKNEKTPLLIFDDSTGKQIDFDLRGTDDQVLSRLSTHSHFASSEAEPQRTGPGRPKLGIVCREVSLLPRHWEWLEQQPQGISATLRKLIEDAKRNEPNKASGRMARDAAGKLMWALAGNLEGFEEASRALYAVDVPRFEKLTQKWPKDIRDHLRTLVRRAAVLLSKSSSEPSAR